LNITVEKDKTLLVDGPASVAILSGRAEVFGAVIKGTAAKNPPKIVIREGKRLPFAIQETADFDLALGAGANVQEVEGSTIPESWRTAYDILREIPKKPVIVFVVGRADSGKSSFCTYLTNRAVEGNCRVVILDEDLGQSDIGAPCTVAYAYVAEEVTDLFNLKPKNSFFVGSSSPKSVTALAIEGVGLLKAEILADQTVDIVIVNTDGWAGEDEAVKFKSLLAATVGPDLVFCLQADEETPSFCAMLGDEMAKFRQERAQSTGAVKERSQEKRRTLRELGYAKYLENAKVRVYTLRHLTVEGEEANLLIRQRQAENLLLGLYDGQKRFLGIGVLREVNYVRNTLRVFTAVLETPLFVSFGKIRLDENLHEIPQA
jgi:polynucleotide 5'-kinase involved in rRNA processing